MWNSIKLEKNQNKNISLAVKTESEINVFRIHNHYDGINQSTAQWYKITPHKRTNVWIALAFVADHIENTLHLVFFLNFFCLCPG